ncbi:MAG TPA: tetratricopeptide repeat protein [Pyrinomonadaceae bacterium]|jgi:predicted Zn-dependent protease|nr:tetratricopeptide repeat protein [Pyrinomonadaceae bacterium]
MSTERIEALRAMSEAQPGEAMIWYGLANEYFKLERWRDAADALRRVVSINPDYTSAYQMLGTSLANLGEGEEARGAWAEGIKVAERTGAWKARQHMEGLLAGAAAAEKGSGLCEQ